MSVYVDNMLRPARVGRIQSRWSHLIADTPEELHAFAARLGMRPEWIQYPGHPREHYDLTEPKRAKAIGMGAVEITYPHGIAEVIDRKKAALMVTPSAAPVHFLTEYGTTRCPVEGVAANADDEGGVLICSACGGVVTPSAEGSES